MDPKKVLIIDDEEDFGLLLKLFFEKKKCEVCVAYNIADGMKALLDFNPDYIFWTIVYLMAMVGDRPSLFCKITPSAS